MLREKKQDGSKFWRNLLSGSDRNARILTPLPWIVCDTGRAGRREEGGYEVWGRPGQIYHEICQRLVRSFIVYHSCAYFLIEDSGYVRVRWKFESISSTAPLMYSTCFPIIDSLYYYHRLDILLLWSTRLRGHPIKLKRLIC